MLLSYFYLNTINIVFLKLNALAKIFFKLISFHYCMSSITILLFRNLKYYCIITKDI